MVKITVNIPNRGPTLPGFPEEPAIECRDLVSGAMLPRWHRTQSLAQSEAS
jgi:hypothetical protein